MISEAQKSNTRQLLKVLVFKLNGQEYGIDASYVRTINPLTKITHVPKVPPFILGVMNLHGRVVPVIDLHRRLDIEAHEAKKFVVVVLIDGKKISLLVNQASEVRDISSYEIMQPPSEAIGIDVDYINGIIQLRDEEQRRMIILLNLERILQRTW